MVWCNDIKNVEHLKKELSKELMVVAWHPRSKLKDEKTEYIHEK